MSLLSGKWEAGSGGWQDAVGMFRLWSPRESSFLGEIIGSGDRPGEMIAGQNVWGVLILGHIGKGSFSLLGVAPVSARALAQVLLRK